VDLGAAGAVVTNYGAGTVSYSDTADPFVAEGTIAPLASATLTGTQFFRAAAGAVLDITEADASLGSLEEVRAQLLAVESSSAAKADPLIPTAVKTSSYTATAQDYVPVDTTAGAVTITLPTAPADKTRIGVKHVIQGGTNAVTIARGGTDVFNKAGGSTSLSLLLLNQSFVLQYKASTGIWYAQSGDTPLSGLDLRYPQTAVANTFTQPQTVKGNVYQQDANAQPLVTLAPTANSPGAYGGQVLLHGAASGETNKRLWYWAIDVVAAVPYRDSVWGKILSNGNASDVDGIYISHGGTGPSTTGIGIAQPAASGSYHRAKIQGASSTDQAAGGVLQLIQGTGAPTGPLLRITSTAGSDRWVLDPSNSGTWAVRVYGDASTSNPVYVIHDVTSGTKEQLRFTANGKIQWADPSTGTTDSNAVIYRSAASIVQIGQNLNVGNFAGIGSAFTGGSAGTTPTAMLDVAQSGATAATLYVRNNQGSIQVTMPASGNQASIVTSNATSISLGVAGVRWLGVTAQGNVVAGGGAKATPLEMATTATDGFLHIPSCSGTPTGVPTLITGAVPIVYDRTNDKIYVYRGGWKATAALV
jgi:hypothetical protein